jgi:isoquinoline 1-oxidoreductase alpha subunit
MPTRHINGQDTVVDADPATPLLWALRDRLGLSGTKFGCGTYARVRSAIHTAARALA